LGGNKGWSQKDKGRKKKEKTKNGDLTEAENGGALGKNAKTGDNGEEN